MDIIDKLIISCSFVVFISPKEEFQETITLQLVDLHNLESRTMYWNRDKEKSIVNNFYISESMKLNKNKTRAFIDKGVGSSGFLYSY